MRYVILLPLLFPTLSFAKIPQDPFITDHFHMIEVNHLYDNQGDHTIDQLIFWDYDPEDTSRIVCQGFLLIKNGRSIKIKEEDKVVEKLWRLPLKRTPEYKKLNEAFHEKQRKDYADKVYAQLLARYGEAFAKLKMKRTNPVPPILFNWVPKYHASDYHPTKFGKGYKAIFYVDGVMRRITSDLLHESWTSYDPEVKDRDRFPKYNRRDLTKLIKVKRK